MPKKKCSAVYDYFEFPSDVATGKVTCKVEGCNAKVLGNHATNLKTHLRCKHRSIYDSVQVIDGETSSSSKKRQASQTVESEPAPKQKTLTDFLGPSKLLLKSVKIKMDKATFEKGCVMMVTKGGCPFRLLSSPGFKMIADPILEALNMKMDEKIVREKVLIKYKEESNHLKKTIAGKLIYLKLDLATRLDRSFLGINIQFEQNGCLEVFNLKVLDISGKSTNAEALTDQLVGVLEEFGIERANVLSITTDNGGNVLKISRLLFTRDEPAFDSESGDSSSDEEDVVETDNNDSPVEVDDVSGDFATEQDDEIDFISISDEVASTNFAAHTLDLAADDIQAIRKVQNSILKLKNVVKILRTKAFRQLPVNKYNKKPVLDNTTRWGSTYDMVKCALDMKDGIIEWGQINPKLKLSAQVWESLESFGRIMEPVRTALIALQKEALTPGDFYQIWLKMKFHLQKITQNDVSRKMLERIEIREKNLIEKNALMIAAIYCDVRFTALLSEDFVQIARREITNIVLKLRRIENGATPSEATSTGDHAVSEAEDEFDLYLDEQEPERERHGASHDILSEIQKNFHELEGMPRQKKSTASFSSLHWWQQRKNWTIGPAAMVLSCLPATQVSVERLFSAMANVLTDKRNRLTGEILDAVLFLRLNGTSADSP